jgi:hypothetical protein
MIVGEQDRRLTERGRGPVSIELTLWGVTPAAFEDWLEGNPSRAGLTRECQEIAKGWAVLHHVLESGSFHPGLAAVALGGGLPLLDGHADYGGTFGITPRVVRAIAEELRGGAAGSYEDDDIRERYEKRRASLRGLYSAAPEDPHEVEVVVDNFHTLRDFYAACAASGDAVVKWLG